MSGVIDPDGTQWEHCNCCGKFVKIDNLGYQKPSAKWPHGRDLCVKCVDTLIQSREVKFRDISPARGWVVSR